MDSGIVKIILLRRSRKILKEIIGLFKEGMESFEGYEEEILSELSDHFEGHRRDTHYFIGKCGESLVGLIGYVRYSRDVYGIGWFAVSREYRRQGLGSLLLKKVEEELRGKARLIVAECWNSAENKPAIKFYRKHGYVSSATIPDFYDDEDGDMAVFIKHL